MSLCFLYYLTLKEVGVLSSKKPLCHPRHPKPNLKILLIYWNVSGKLLSQSTSCCSHGLKLLHTPNFQVFSTVSNMMVKVARYLPKSETAFHRCLQQFTGKYLFKSIFFNKVGGLHPRKKLLHRCFPVSFAKYFRTLFLRNTFGWWLLLLNIISLLRQPHKQNVTLDPG